MSILSELDKATSRKSILVLITALLFLAPGVSIIAAFFPESLENLETFKVLMLSIAVAVPSFLCAFFVAGSSFADSLPKDSGEYHFSSTFISAVIAAFALYLSLGVAYWKGASFKEFLLLDLCITIGCSMLGWAVSKTKDPKAE